MINTANMAKAYSEVYAFLNVAGDEYINKIPIKIYTAIKNNRDFNYNPVYKSNQIMTKEIISKEALSLIAGLNLQYWCEDEEEKKRLKQCYIENGRKEQEKYSYENLFKKEQDKEEKVIENETALIEYEGKSSIFLKLIKRMKSWFNNIRMK